METIVLVIFILGYLAITLEHSLKIDKLIPALIMMAFAWTAVAIGIDGTTTWFDSHHGSLLDISLFSHEEKFELFESTLLHHFGKTCEILIFLVGAMTIVEIIDHFNGFVTIKKFVKTNKKRTLLWIICILGFILSAIIDNLTATIVLITILRKIIHDNQTRMWYAGLIIIAANAGGAWSPIGDVTTTMLWVGKKVTPGPLIEYLIIPSLLCMIIPTLIASFLPVFKGNFEDSKEEEKPNKHGGLVLAIGLSMIIFVPIFKTLTHLPPYIGMMFSLAVVSIVAEVITNRKFSLSEADNQEHTHGPTFKALSRIEMPSVLFFLGILMTVASLESLGMIFNFGVDVNAAIPENLFVTLLGIGSAVIDNVPLVAASMGMFPDSIDAPVWHLIAFSAGTGGSMLIIGSAAGVVAMGMEKISFFWYLKNISLLALLGFAGGIGAFLLMHM